MLLQPNFQDLTFVYIAPIAADAEFEELCFDFGIELEDVVRVSAVVLVSVVETPEPTN